MSSRDKFGHYINEKGVTFKVHTDKNGKDHFDAYEGPLDGKHSAVHVTIDCDKEKWNSYYHDKDHKGEHDKEDKNCFLTTACMKKYAENFDDNCYELQTLRWFRDHHVTQEDIACYYHIAPAVVYAIDQLENSKEVYTDIYNRIIRVCVQAIECKNYDFAYQTYRTAVLELKQMYLA